MASPFQDSDYNKQCSVPAHQPAAQEQQRQPQPGAQPDKAENRGGFDCEFVERPPEVLQSECPVCLQIIRDPYQVTCCGYSFCHSCIERIKADNKPCPTCNVKGFSDFPDKRLERSLYAFKVRCSRQKDGCEWTGELGQLDVHLNKDPPSEKRHVGCPLTTISCDFAHVGCVVKLARRDMPEHLRENFLVHLSLLTVSHSNLASSHAKQQAQITQLLAENSTLKSDNVKLEHNRCSLETRSDSLVDKIVGSPESHTTLSANHTRLQESHTTLSANHARLQESHTTLSANHARLQESHTTLCANHTRLKESHATLSAIQARLQESHTTLSASHTRLQESHTTLSARLLARINNLTIEVNNLRESQDGLLAYNLQKQETGVVEKTKVSATDRVTGARVKIPLVPSAVLTMTNFQRHKKDKDDWYSPPVYTHHQGYKIHLRVVANGYDSAKGTHVSVFVHFMRGEFDDFLKWPFRGVISFQLLDQVNGEDHKTFSAVYDDRVHIRNCSRVLWESRNGYGPFEFVAHGQLKPKYLRNDMLQLQVYDGEVFL